jgi:hypothetical protein
MHVRERFQWRGLRLVQEGVPIHLASVLSSELLLFEAQ